MKTNTPSARVDGTLLDADARQLCGRNTQPGSDQSAQVGFVLGLFEAQLQRDFLRQVRQTKALFRCRGPGVKPRPKVTETSDPNGQAART